MFVLYRTSKGIDTAALLGNQTIMVLENVEHTEGQATDNEVPEC